VFSKYEYKCHSTADFISDFVSAIPDEPRTGYAFSIYICEFPNYKFNKLNNYPINNKIYEDYMNSQELCNFLFDKCGTSGWEVVHTDVGRFKMRNSGQLEFAYGLYVMER
jgi:hypothetical protein